MKNKQKPIIIVGSGGHAGVVLEVLQEQKLQVLGLIDPSKKLGEKYFGIEVIGDDNSILDFPSNKILLANGLGSLPNNNQRWNLAKKMRQLGYQFISIVHPKAIISKSVSLAEGSQIMAGCILQHDVSIGLDSIVNTGSIIDHDCKIGSNCHIAPGSVLSGNVIVGDGVHIGTGVAVIQERKIGKNAIIAAGSVIYKDVQPNTTFIQLLQKK